MNIEMTLDQLIKNYVEIRSAKQRASKAFEAETERMTAALAKLDGLILKALHDAGAESVKTEFGTAYTSRRSSVSVKDRDRFYNWAVATDNLYAIDMRANAKHVRELLSEGVEVPGINYSELVQARVRKA